MSGTLTIHSSGTGQLLSGHSWIEYAPDDGSATKTYGTWGNDPTGAGNGLFEDLELGRASDASRSALLDNAQEAALMQKIQQVKDQGADGWGYLSPCSSFAASSWQTATGEKLDDRWGIISNPSTLKDSIAAANKKDADAAAAAAAAPPADAGAADVDAGAADAGAAAPPARPDNSRRDVGSSVQCCGHGS